MVSVIGFEDMIAPEAITAAAGMVLRIRTEQPGTDLQWTIRDVLQEEITASNIAVDSAGFETLRLALFDRYRALRIEKSLEPDDL